jgi:hypothetical protein
MAFKGDLISASLSDVLQMLYHNGKEGTLRVFGTNFMKSLYCSREGITLLNPDILESRNFGGALVAMGIAEKEKVERAATRVKGRISVSDAFVKSGLVDEDTLKRMIKHHVTEEVYGLFDLTSGEFEFQEGSDGEQALQQDNLPVIPVGTVLLESARRIDEWQHLGKDIGNLENIFVKKPDCDEEEDPEGLKVLKFVNGRSTVRQISDCLLLSPIAVAKIMAKLVERNRIRPLDKDEFLNLARELIENKEIEDVGAILQQLRPNLKNIISEDIDVGSLADLYSQEGDLKTATGLLLEKADQTGGGEADDADSYLEQAHKIDPEDMRVLMELAEACSEKGDKEGRIRHLCALVFVCLKGEQYDRAFKTCNEILEAGIEDTYLMENIPPFPDGLAEGGEAEFLEGLIIDNMPDFLVEAANKQGAVEFLENMIHKLGGDHDPRHVAGLYSQIIRAEASDQTAAAPESESP